MNSLISPNRWSCVLTSFAMVLGESIEQLIYEIGHDGSEIVFPHLEEPFRRRAFHLQELFDCAIRRKVYPVQIDSMPVATPDWKHNYEVPIKNPEDRISSYLGMSSGVITGYGQSGTPHAVAWDHTCEMIIDPANGKTYNIGDFMIQSFYLCSTIQAENENRKNLGIPLVT